MTVKKYNDLIHRARTDGRLVKRYETCLPFSPSETEIELYELDGYYVEFHDGHANGVKNKVTGEYIDPKNLTTFDVLNMNEMQLQALIQDAQQEIQKRQMDKLIAATKEFSKGWDALREFKNARLRLTIKGKEHFHVEVGDLEIGILPPSDR